ncbi:MAG: DUF465 domain-containing protein [Paracoccaceae bacterium]
MPTRKSPKVESLAARRKALSEIKSKLDLRIANENSRPLPDPSQLSRLKRMKLRAKDELTSIQTILGVREAARQTTVG